MKKIIFLFVLAFMFSLFLFNTVVEAKPCWKDNSCDPKPTHVPGPVQPVSP